MTVDLTLLYRKSNTRKTILFLFVLFVLVFSLTACSDESKGSENISIMQEPSLPLEIHDDEFLYGNIPAPTNADVFILATSADEKYYHYSFSFDNFTLKEAEDYIDLLEESLIEKCEFHDVYTENDYPILNYFGWLKDGNAVSLSQCNTSGGITINVKKS